MNTFFFIQSLLYFLSVGTVKRDIVGQVSKTDMSENRVCKKGHAVF